MKNKLSIRTYIVLIISVFCIVALSIVVFSSLNSSQEQKNTLTVFPSDNTFSSRLELISVSEKNDEEYNVVFKAVIRNESEQDFLLYGNPSCWSTLVINGKNTVSELPLGTYLLRAGEELVEEKSEAVSKSDFESGSCYCISSFFLVNSNEEKQEYSIKSEVYNLYEMNI